MRLKWLNFKFITGNICVVGSNVVCYQPVTVQDFSKAIKLSADTVIKYFQNQKQVLKAESMLSQELLAEACINFNFNLLYNEKYREDLIGKYLAILDSVSIKKQIRPPIVTILGHINHGKTTLLDQICHSEIAKHEHGLITQHIGAHTVSYHNKTITFIDTPGHQAFIDMRVQGSAITDLAIIVIAIDDGINEQTIEAIKHVKLAKVPVIVFINKIDKGLQNYNKIVNELAKYNLVSEAQGGNTIIIKGSASNKIGINHLLKAILLVAELTEIYAKIDLPASGVILDANLNRQMGPIILLIVTNGILTQSDYLITDSSYGKIRSMTDSNHKLLKQAYPGSTVTIQGLIKIPKLGERFAVCNNEKMAKNLVNRKIQILRNLETKNRSSLTLEKLNQEIIKSKQQQVNLIIKTDVNGTLQAIKYALHKLTDKQDTYSINIVYSSVGGITDSDLALAITTNAIIIGFNVTATSLIKKRAKNSNIRLELHNVIYNIIELVTDLTISLQPVQKQEIEAGVCKIQKIFQHSASISCFCTGCKLIVKSVTNSIML